MFGPTVGAIIRFSLSDFPSPRLSPGLCLGTVLPLSDVEGIFSATNHKRNWIAKPVYTQSNTSGFGEFVSVNRTGQDDVKVDSEMIEQKGFKLNFKQLRGQCFYYL